MDNKYKVLFAVLIGSMLGPIDASVVNVAMPTFSKVFNAPVTTVSWVSMSYLLVLSSLLLTFGRLGDLMGYKSLYITGMGVFTASSLFCGLANKIGVLIFFRALQAAGAGMMMAVAPAIITNTFPKSERGKALGFNAMSVAVGLAIGPSLGGFLLTYYGYRSIFLINIPIGLLGMLLSNKVIPRFERKKKEPFDIEGAFLAFVFLFSILTFLSKGQEYGWSSKKSIFLLLFSIISFVLFILREKRFTHPMLDLTLFKNRMFAASNISCLLNYTAQYMMIFLMPFFLTKSGYSSSEIGIIMTAFPLTVLLIAPISGILFDKSGSLILSTTGAGISALSLVLLSKMPFNFRSIDVITRLIIFGIGNGLFQTPNNSAVMGSAPKDKQGVAAGVLATMRNTGMVLGIALSGGLLALRQNYYLRILPKASNINELSFLYGVKDALFLAAFIDFLCILTSSTRGKNEESIEEDVFK
ncbi:MAG: MFS transporter [Thermovenabulum sp.]|uniref:MFS transporter n=1 Tax=Thermovenabulum sp. TaxID=3100335 RepID=UPI003C7B8A81